MIEAGYPPFETSHHACPTCGREESEEKWKSYTNLMNPPPHGVEIMICKVCGNIRMADAHVWEAEKKRRSELG